MVLAGSYSGLGSEVREGRIAAWLRLRGVDTRIFRIASPDSSGSSSHFDAFGQQVPLNFFAADDASGGHHAHVSLALFQGLEAFRPDAILVKGFGYELTRLICAHWNHRARLIGVVGGLISSEASRCHVLLIEDEYQAGTAAALVRPGATVELLPKLVPWDDIDRLADVRRSIDIVNVGNLEPRKRQELLAQTFSDLDVCIVGGGERLQELKARFAAWPKVRFMGHRPRLETLQLMKAARLIVHVSNFEGYPRVFAEAAACATPVLTLGEVTPVARADERGVFLSSLASLRTDVIRLLADPALLQRMGRQGQAHARATALESHIQSTVARALGLSQA
jgi:glycosyltransferase involved in cell wall biosynthesis